MYIVFLKKKFYKIFLKFVIDFWEIKLSFHTTNIRNYKQKIMLKMISTKEFNRVMASFLFLQFNFQKGYLIIISRYLHLALHFNHGYKYDSNNLVASNK